MCACVWMRERERERGRETDRLSALKFRNFVYCWKVCVCVRACVCAGVRGRVGGRGQG